MAYTIGTSHGPFSGVGSFAIAKPVGIRTVITGIPFFTGRDSSLPTRYFRLGQFTLGNAHGFIHSQPLEYAQQLLYPVRPDWEVLAYDVKDGASATFYELVDVPDLTSKMPWDRTPQSLNLWFRVDPTTIVPETTGLSYTVPVGRKLMLSLAEAWISCMATQNAGARSINELLRNGDRFLQVYMQAMTIGQRQVAAMGGGPLVLSAGESLAARYAIDTAGGRTAFGANLSGMLFDA